MTQMNLFPDTQVQQMSEGELLYSWNHALSSKHDRYWHSAIQSGSALREFYETHDHNAYTRFAQSCQVFARESGYPFVEAAQRIHNMFNIKAGNR